MRAFHHGQLEKVYVSQGFPVTLPDKTKVFVNVTPTGIGLSNPGIDPDKMRVSGLVTAKVEVSTTMLVPAPIALPPKQTVPPGAPLMNVALPLRAPYDTIRTVVLRAITGKDFAEDTPAGKVNVTINDVEIYPSGERLVIGLKVSAKLPSSWFNTSGDVYLFAKPVVDGPSRIHLADIGFARKLDNDFWNATTAIFQRQIIGALAEASRYDLATDIENAKEVLNHALRDPKATPGVKVAVTEVSMGLGRISIAEKELSVEGLFSGKMTISPGS